jgi:carbon monoxide dehydrogenase subunit G
MMVEIARVKDVIAAPIEAVWEILADFGKPQRMAKTIDRCDLTGTGVGAVRVVYARGREIHERLLKLDPQNHELSYEILPSGDVPADGLKRYVATVTLKAISAGETFVDWSSEGEVDGELEPVASLIASIYAGAIAVIGKTAGKKV